MGRRSKSPKENKNNGNNGIVGDNGSVGSGSNSSGSGPSNSNSSSRNRRNRRKNKKNNHNTQNGSGNNNSNGNANGNGNVTSPPAFVRRVVSSGITVPNDDQWMDMGCGSNSSSRDEYDFVHPLPLRYALIIVPLISLALILFTFNVFDGGAALSSAATNHQPQHSIFSAVNFGSLVGSPGGGTGTGGGVTGAFIPAHTTKVSLEATSPHHMHHHQSQQAATPSAANGNNGNGGNVQAHVDQYHSHLIHNDYGIPEAPMAEIPTISPPPSLCSDGITYGYSDWNSLRNAVHSLNEIRAYHQATVQHSNADYYHHDSNGIGNNGNIAEYFTNGDTPVVGGVGVDVSSSSTGGARVAASAVGPSAAPLRDYQQGYPSPSMMDEYDPYYGDSDADEYYFEDDPPPPEPFVICPGVTIRSRGRFGVVHSSSQSSYSVGVGSSTSSALVGGVGPSASTGAVGMTDGAGVSYQGSLAAAHYHHSLNSNDLAIFIDHEDVRIECDACIVDMPGTHFSFGPNAKNVVIRGLTLMGARSSSLTFHHHGADATFEDCTWIGNAGLANGGAVADLNSTSSVNFLRCEISDSKQSPRMVAGGPIAGMGGGGLVGGTGGLVGGGAVMGSSLTIRN